MNKLNPKSSDDLIALFDMDGTLADYDFALLASLAKIHSEYEPPLGDLDLHNLPPAYEARRRLIIQSPRWWRDIPPFKLGFDVLAMTTELGFENYILTKGPIHCPNAWKEKMEWCLHHVWQSKHVTGMNIVTAKGLVYGRVLVDDFPEYIEAWLKHRPRGLVIMPANNWNAAFTHPQVIRYDGTNQDQVKEGLLWARDRESGNGK